MAAQLYCRGQSDPVDQPRDGPGRKPLRYRDGDRQFHHAAAIPQHAGQLSNKAGLQYRQHDLVYFRPVWNLLYECRGQLQSEMATSSAICKTLRVLVLLPHFPRKAGLPYGRNSWPMRRCCRPTSPPTSMAMRSSRASFRALNS